MPQFVMTDTYIFEVKWYSEVTEEDHVSYGTIGANSYAEAMNSINKRFPDIERVTIHLLFEYNGFYFFGKDEYKKVLWENQIENEEEYGETQIPEQLTYNIDKEVSSHNEGGIWVYMNHDETVLHIRKGSGSCITEKEKKDGYSDYAKITEYTVEPDNSLVLNKTEIFFLKDFFEFYSNEFLIERAAEQLKRDGKRHNYIIYQVHC